MEQELSWEEMKVKIGNQLDKLQKERSELLLEVKVLLEDLLRCGTFYGSSIELNEDMSSHNQISGGEFHKRIKKLLKKLK